jgi:hypothetical protein
MKIYSNFWNKKTLVSFEEKYSNLPITLFMDFIPDHTQLRENPINILYIHEPNEFFGLHNYAIQNSSNFSAILTWSEDILSKCDNGVKFFHNSIISNKNIKLIEEFANKDKKFEISFLSGVKNLSEGHKLRQQIFKEQNKITTPKSFYYTLDDFDLDKQVRPGYIEYSKDLSHIPEGEAPELWGKRICFESMFHIAAENVKHNNWYTEKIGQAFISKVVPIYWGCPNIEEFGYDSRGILFFNTIDELVNISNNLTFEKYKEMLPYIEYNYQIALQDTFTEKLEMFFDQLKINNNL